MTSTSRVPPAPFDWDGLDAYLGSGSFGPHYPADWRSFWAGRDRVHELICAVLEAATRSVVVSMYGYDLPDADAIIRAKTLDPRIFVQLNLDSSQAAGKAEAAILKEWNHEAFATSVAVGRSAHGAISHLKVAIIDGIYTITGSTNWSAGGAEKQDNQLLLSRDPYIAAEYRQRCDVIHTTMLAQMAKAAAAGATPASP